MLLDKFINCLSYIQQIRDAEKKRYKVYGIKDTSNIEITLDNAWTKRTDNLNNKIQNIQSLSQSQRQKKKNDYWNAHSEEYKALINQMEQLNRDRKNYQDVLSERLNELRRIIECFYKDSFGQQFAEVTYAQIKGALSEKTTIKYNNDNVYICKKKSVPASASWTSNPSKAQFAKENGILSEDIADRYCGLYELRNNAHLLKAANASYFPKPKEAKEAYQLVYQFINEIKNCFINNNKVKSKKENEIDAATN